MIFHLINVSSSYWFLKKINFVFSHPKALIVGANWHLSSHLDTNKGLCLHLLNTLVNNKHLSHFNQSMLLHHIDLLNLSFHILNLFTWGQWHFEFTFKPIRCHVHTCFTFCAGGELFISVRVFFLEWYHPWMDDEMDGWMDGWKKLHEKRSGRPLLYVILINNTQSMPLQPYCYFCSPFSFPKP